MIAADDFLQRVLPEIGNGIWFMLSMALTIAFAIYIIKVSLNWRSWDRGPWALLAAIGLMFWFLGSGIRAASAWLVWINDMPLLFTSYMWLRIVALVLGIVGAIWCLAVFNRWLVCAVAVIICIGVPVAVYAFR